jgi:hypothetical protein
MKSIDRLQEKEHTKSIVCCIGQLSISITKYLIWTNLKEERFVLVHGLRGFSPRLAGSIAFWPLVRQHPGGDHMVGLQLLTSWCPGSKEKGEANRERSMGVLDSSRPIHRGLRTAFQNPSCIYRSQQFFWITSSKCAKEIYLRWGSLHFHKTFTRNLIVKVVKIKMAIPNKKQSNTGRLCRRGSYAFPR